MDDSAKENFNIPPGFTLEEINAQLYYEDLDKDDELWLIRMPCDIKLSNLDKKKIYLSNNSGDTSVKNIKTEDGQLLECYAETCKIPSTCVVLPQKNDGQLHAVKKVFKGAVLISEGICYDEIEIKAENEQLDGASSNLESAKGKTEKKKHSQCSLEASELEIKPDNEDETPKAAQSSAGNIKEKKSKKKHKQAESTFDASEIDIKSENDDEQLDNVPNSANEPKERKNKKKKKQSQFNFDSSELNYETEDADNLISESQKKRKKHSRTHKKSSSESVEIKNEPLPIDWDGFPMCTSQK